MAQGMLSATPILSSSYSQVAALFPPLSPARPATPTDVDLLALIATSDIGALGELYDRHIATLFPVALRIMQNRSEAEDVVHDLFVLVHERAKHYLPARGSVIAWLVTLVRNLSINRMRRCVRPDILASEAITHELATTARQPEMLASMSSERSTIQRSLAKLPDQQRHTLEAIFFEGISYSAIAERDGIPLATIKSRVASALSALGEALSSEGLPRATG